MADIADIANDRVEQLQAEALKRQVGKSAPEMHPDFNGMDCVDCAEPVQPARLTLGRVRCVQCQRALESRRARGLA